MHITESFKGDEMLDVGAISRSQIKYDIMILYLALSTNRSIVRVKDQSRNNQEDHSRWFQILYPEAKRTILCRSPVDYNKLYQKLKCDGDRYMTYDIS